MNHPILMTSGYGQHHTDEPDPNKPNKILRPYVTIGLVGIRGLVDNPQKCDKAQAQWLIPSELPSRNFKRQEQEGTFWMLGADLDDDPENPDYFPPTLPSLEALILYLLGDCNYELYNSRSATVDMQKAHILIPLNKPLSGADWVLAQETLNNKLEDLGIRPDRATERAAQLCYLPNKGVFYGSRSKRDGVYFNPLTAWQAEITTRRDEIEAQRMALEAAKTAAKVRRETLAISDGDSSFERLKNTFNTAYTPQDWMISADYDQLGDTFRHPNSQTGNYSASVKPDAFGVLRVNALSSADPLYTAGQGAHDAFSAFCTLVHGGDVNAAIKDAGDNLLTIGGLSYNKAVRREFQQTKAAQTQPKPQKWTPP